MATPRILLISHVYPFPGDSGQQRRVINTLLGLRKQFHVSFLTFAPKEMIHHVKGKLNEFCDESIVLPSKYEQLGFWGPLLSHIYAVITGLKRSNFTIGICEFPATRLRKFLERGYDLVLLEYWHAWRGVQVFRRAGVPVTVDLHDILWQSFHRQLSMTSYLTEWFRCFAVRRYQRKEERAWQKFDSLIAINRDEFNYVLKRVSSTIGNGPFEKTDRSRFRIPPPVYYVPMGVDFSNWKYQYDPVQPSRLAYYGSFGSAQNREMALLCANEIMPRVWEHYPQAELWLVGSSANNALGILAKDARIRITGYLPDVAQVLSTMSALLCPWKGTYGFRSRIVEVMALGIPVIANPDAVAGMEFEDGKEILLSESAEGIADFACKLLANTNVARDLGKCGHASVLSKYSFEMTYSKLAVELVNLCTE